MGDPGDPKRLVEVISGCGLARNKFVGKSGNFRRVRGCLGPAWATAIIDHGGCKGPTVAADITFYSPTIGRGLIKGKRSLIAKIALVLHSFDVTLLNEDRRFQYRGVTRDQ